MSGAELFGAAGLDRGGRLPALRAASRRASVSAQGWLQIAIYVAVLTALTPPLGAYMARVYRGELQLSGAGRARALPASCASTRAPGRTGSPTRAPSIVFSALFWVALYVILRTQGIHPFNPEGFDSGTWDVSFNTASSFVSNTNWQFYGGETTLTLLLADGRPGGAELRLRGGGHGRAGRRDPRLREPRRGGARQLLAGPRPHAALHPGAAVVHRRARAGLAGRGADAERHGRLHHRPGTRRGARARARSPPRSRSSSSAPTAAASSTSTAPSRSRTPPASRTSSSCCSSC